MTPPRIPVRDYLRQTNNGRWVDTRHQYARGDNVRIIKGPLQGRIAMVESKMEG